MAFTWTDDPLTAGNIFYDKVHYTELHAALWQLYTDAGLTTDPFDTWKITTFPEFYTDIGLIWKPQVRNDWIYELRNGINNSSLLSSAGYSDLADLLNTAIGQSDWIDPILTAGQTFVRNDHIEELRLAMDNLEITGETWTPATVGAYNLGDTIEGVTDWYCGGLIGILGVQSIVEIDENKKYRSKWNPSPISGHVITRLESDKLTIPDIFYDYLLTLNTKLALKCDGYAHLTNPDPIDGSFHFRLGATVVLQDETFIYYDIFNWTGTGAKSWYPSGIYTWDIDTSQIGKKVKSIYLWVDWVLGFTTSSLDWQIDWDNINLYEG